MSKVFTRHHTPIYIDSTSNEPTMNIGGSVGISTGLVIPNWDAVLVTYPTTLTEVYTFKTGGESGTTVSVVTVTYSDTAKTTITKVIKS